MQAEVTRLQARSSRVARPVVERRFSSCTMRQALMGAALPGFAGSVKVPPNIKNKEERTPMLPSLRCVLRVALAGVVAAAMASEAPAADKVAVGTGGSAS